MSQAIFVNNCTTALSADVAQGATSLPVRAGEGTKFGTISTGQHIWTRIGLPNGDQRVRVIGRTGDVLTLDPSTPTTRAWSAGTTVKVTVCAELLAEIQQVEAGTTAIAAAIAAHKAEENPHPVYLTQTEADGRYVQPDDISGFGTGDMLGSRNLNEVTDPAEARGNLGLGEVDNTSDLDKPVSTATQTALDLKLDASAYNDRFKGLYTTLSALQAAYPAGAAGDYAQVDSGTGGALHIYSWDVSDSAWVLTSADGTGAANTDQLPEGTSNLYFTVGRAIAACTGVFQAASSLLSAIAALSGSGWLKFTSGTPSVAAIAVADLPVNITTYDMAFGYMGKPGADQKFNAFRVVTPTVLPAGLTGSSGAPVSANPTSNYVVSIHVNGIQIGTVTYTGGGSSVSFALAADVTLAVGDTILPVGQSTTDATLDYPIFTLKGRVV
ncbi:hypothetical protein SAMN02949497_1750 [Methylomagnum ishizawai]|uniref:Tail fiber protein n=1 Tax=Methylomagnum ishizawai TaxID=1760988 RepID=A0A1Y6D377_9GAMM|nr:hypothetical protein [Methylomagnum ishizawai]SMF94435.1 hypothetical protein SAMN02949497_1750 [Methylomagnum ishizawai]